MGAELRDHRRPPPGLARVQADVQRTVDAGEVRLSESSPSATRFRRAGRGRVEVITFKPLSKNPGALHLFENVAAIEMALVVEMVVDRGMDGGECLQGLDVSEPSHCPFPPSKGLM